MLLRKVLIEQVRDPYAWTVGALFVALKITSVIDWPWLWVLAPIWIPLVTYVAVDCTARLFFRIFRSARRVHGERGHR